jgi:hypothetical protein
MKVASRFFMADLINGNGNAELAGRPFLTPKLLRLIELGESKVGRPELQARRCVQNLRTGAIAKYAQIANSQGVIAVCVEAAHDRTRDRCAHGCVDLRWRSQRKRRKDRGSSKRGRKEIWEALIFSGVLEIARDWRAYTRSAGCAVSAQP